MSDALLSIAKNWLRREKPYLYDLEGDEKDLDEDGGKLAKLLLQAQNDAITASASVAMSMTCHTDGERQLRSDTVVHIMAMRRASPSEGEAPR